MPRPIAWTIAGSDSGGGAGIQADLHTFQALDVHGCSVITALTAQNSYEVTRIEYPSSEMIAAQISVLEKDLPARAIKLGMLGNIDVMQTIQPFLKKFEKEIPIVCDPVMVSTSGAELLEPAAKNYLIQHIIPLATVITPNLVEAQSLLNDIIKSSADIEKAAHDLLQLGCKSVLIKGGHFQGNLAQDYWTNRKISFWLNVPRLEQNNTHGSGCTLSSAIAAALALGYDIQNALIIAKAYITQAIFLAEKYGKGPGPVMPHRWVEQEKHFPTVSYDANLPQLKFLDCGEDALGIYPLVGSAKWIEKLLQCGVTTIQLRNKNLKGAALEKEIQESVAIARKFNARLFINDAWELAIKYQAYGVHLGQEDLANADLAAIANAKLRLGISTHNYWELAVAAAVQPSYIACGPVYSSTSKVMRYSPVGIGYLKHVCQLLNFPIVAIGGINKENIAKVEQCGVSGIAMLSEIAQIKTDLLQHINALQRCVTKRNFPNKN